MKSYQLFNLVRTVGFGQNFIYLLSFSNGIIDFVPYVDTK